MAVPVDIYVKDESPMPVSLAGVEVGIFDPGTHNLVASATTDADGLAAFSLPGAVTPGASYEVRFFKLGINFHGLKTIQVVDPVQVGEPNKFDHTGTDSNILPLSGSPLLCRCTGVFVDFTGQPIANKTVRIMARAENLCEVPKVWDGRMVPSDELELRTDSSGRISVNLLRTGKYFVTFGGDDDTVWSIIVPDQYSVDLIALIHPFPVVWDWDDTDAPSDAVTIAVNETKDIDFLVTFSDYEQKNKNLDIIFEIDNSDTTKIAAVYVSDAGKIQIRGVSAGVAAITPKLKPGLLPNRWPIPTPTLPVLNITVS